jgi:ABC-2 type transport system permease protein
LKRRSALFVLLGLPVLTMLLLTGINWLARSQAGGDGGGNRGGAFTEFVFGGNEESLPQGLVDETGRIDLYPPPADRLFVALPTVLQAQAAYEAGEIAGYYVIPTDYLVRGDIFYYADQLSFESPERTLLYEMLAIAFVGEEAPIERIVNPLPVVQEVNLSAGQEQEGSEGISIILGIAVALLFYLTAMGASGYLLQSLGVEKQNRVMEILLSSLRPLELLLGKVLGLGAIGLLQMAIWSTVALFVFQRGESTFSNIPLPTLAPSVWALIVLHFIVGYLVYASLFAGLGAVTPNPKESSQYTFFLMLPTFLPMWFNSIMVSAPNGAFATTLSLVPLTAPLAMPMRLSLTAVPTWQWVVSLGLSLVAAGGILWLATKLFHSRTLLSGQSPSLRGIWQTLREA